MDTLFDMHCHLGFTPDPARTARDGATAGIAALSCTVEPSEYERLQPMLASCDSVALGLGVHPWWIADGRVGERQLATFCALAPQTSYIGEIGLDFAGIRDNEESRVLQRAALTRILAACNKPPATGSSPSDRSSSLMPCIPKLLSLHAVKAAGDTLDLLESAKTLEQHRVIFHWFSGTSDDLGRAIDLGCFFSVGPRMLASRRGREYVRQIPLAHLVLETDMPSRAGEPLSAAVWQAELGNALAGIAQIKGFESASLAPQLAATSEELLSRGASVSDSRK